MTIETTGTHSNTTNPREHVATAEREAPAAPQSAQELTPDRPPQPLDEGKGKRARGFAAMDRKIVSEIARKGGKAAHSAGTAHEFTSEEARVAGRKGGRATHAKRRKVTEGEPTAAPTEETKERE